MQALCHNEFSSEIAQSQTQTLSLNTPILSPSSDRFAVGIPACKAREGNKMENNFFPNWFRDHEVKGTRAIRIMQKYRLDPKTQFGRMVCIEFLAAREREREQDKAIISAWGLFASFCIRVSGQPTKTGKEPEPLFYSAEGEQIREELAKRGDLR